MSQTSTLILIDVQKGFSDPIWGARNNPDAEKTIGKLLEYWRNRRWPVIHVQHLSLESNSPLNPRHSGSDFMDVATPIQGERILKKQVNSAFIGTDLEMELRLAGLQELFFCGFTTDHCVSTSVRMAKNLGFSPAIVADATVAFDRLDHRGNHYKADLVHAVSIASLNGEFAKIAESKNLLEN